MIMTGILLVIGVAIGIVVLQVLMTVLGAFLDSQPDKPKQKNEAFTLEAWIPFIIIVIIVLIVVASTQ